MKLTRPKEAKRSVSIAEAEKGALKRRGKAASVIDEPVPKSEQPGRRKPENSRPPLEAPEHVDQDEDQDVDCVMDGLELEDDDQDDDAFRELITRAMEAAAMAPEAPDSEGQGVPLPPTPKAVTIEEAREALLAGPVPTGVEGCSSAEACVGGIGDTLQRFKGFEHDLYCTMCCKKLRREYSALKTTPVAHATAAAAG